MEKVDNNKDIILNGEKEDKNEIKLENSEKDEEIIKLKEENIIKEENLNIIKENEIKNEIINNNENNHINENDINHKDKINNNIEENENIEKIKETNNQIIINNDEIKNLDNNVKNKIEKDNIQPEDNVISINAILNQKSIKKNKEESKNNENNVKDKINPNFDKRKSFPIKNSLKIQTNNIEDKNLNLNKNHKNKDNEINDKKYMPQRSYSTTVLDTKEKSSKKNFYNELVGNPKYKKILVLKEETESALKKTVENKCSSSIIKSLVSRTKARFCYDGFDLDLTYITIKIIAMGLPSTALEGIYRNNMDDVKKFFNVRHPNHHKVYNLCKEKNYPKNTFYEQGYYPFPDHEAPPLNILMPFCEDAKKFLDKDDKNVVAIHCKAGKGRTGTFICCLLLYLRIFDTADECMKYYGLMRVGAEKGVTVPSQKRYIHYFELILKYKIPTPLVYKSVIIIEFKLFTVPSFSKFGSSCTPTFIIENGEKIYKNSDHTKKKTYNSTAKIIEFPLNYSGFSVSGDVLVTFYHLTFFGKDKMFKFWFNTNFLPESGILELKKHNLDKAFKDKENKLFSPDFKVLMKYFFV